MENVVKCIKGWFEELSKRSFCKYVVSFGVGVLSSMYLLLHIRMRVAPIGVEIFQIISSETQVPFYEWELMLLISGIVAIIVAPLFTLEKKKRLTRIFVLIFLFFVNVVGLLTIVIQGRVPALFVISLITMATYMCALLIDAVGHVYNWLLIKKDESKQVDVAKLTLIWAIIVFALGLLLR